MGYYIYKEDHDWFLEILDYYFTNVAITVIKKHHYTV